MGSIWFIYRNPEAWYVEHAGQLKPEYGGEPVLRVRYGSVDDFYTEDLEILMRESIYNKLIAGNYTVAKTYSKLSILDENNYEIPPLAEGAVY